MDNIVLIGFMGSGKTSVGMRLAKTIGYQFLDTDQYIETKSEKKIKDIFADDGEETFRKLETKTIKELANSLHHCVVATGGGLPLREENVAMLHQIGLIVFLKTSKEVTYERLKEDTTRPLLAGDNAKQKIETLLNQRIPIYEKAADRTIITDNRPFHSIIEEIQELCDEVR